MVLAGNKLMRTRNRVIAERVAKFVREHSIRSICDYGCGDGSLLHAVKTMVPELKKLTGIDYFSTMDGEKKPVKSGAIEFIDRASEEFEFSVRNSSFDLVLMAFSLHHFQYPVRELLKIRSMLSRPGHIFVCEHDYRGEGDSHNAKNFIFFLDEYFKAELGEVHRHHYTVEEALDIFACLSPNKIEWERIAIEESREEFEKRREEHLKRNEMKRKVLENMDPLRFSIFTRLFDMEKEIIKSCGLDMSRFIILTMDFY